MIALLREQKQAIINQAVTRGLDPNVPSNLRHPLARRCPRALGGEADKVAVKCQTWCLPRPIEDPRYFDDCGEYAWVRIADVTASEKYLRETTALVCSWSVKDVRLQPGALFLSIAGSVGKPIITRIKCCIHDGFVYFPSFRGNGAFITYSNLVDCMGAWKTGHPAQSEYRYCRKHRSGGLQKRSKLRLSTILRALSLP